MWRDINFGSSNCGSCLGICNSLWKMRFCKCVYLIHSYINSNWKTLHSFGWHWIAISNVCKVQIFALNNLGGDYIIPVGRKEILSRFAEIPAVLKIFQKIYFAVTCKKFRPGKAGPLVSIAGTKFSHVIASVRLSGMKNLFNKSVWKNPYKYISLHRSYFYCIFTTYITFNLWEKCKQMSLKNFIILWTFLNQWKSMVFIKQIQGGDLSRLAGMKLDFPM